MTSLEEEKRENVRNAGWDIQGISALKSDKTSDFSSQKREAPEIGGNFYFSPPLYFSWPGHWDSLRRRIHKVKPTLSWKKKKSHSFVFSLKKLRQGYQELKRIQASFLENHLPNCVKKWSNWQLLFQEEEKSEGKMSLEFYCGPIRRVFFSSLGKRCVFPNRSFSNENPEPVKKKVKTDAAAAWQ